MKIEIKNITYKYMQDTPFEKVALNGVSLAIETGEFLGIIGHTGSGKTTLIQHFNALLLPFTGEVRLDGVKVNKENAASFRKKVGLVFQYPEYQLFEETVYKDIKFGIKDLDINPRGIW